MTAILLDPVDFDALHLSTLANGKIGRGQRSRYLARGSDDDDIAPHCVVGHILWLAGVSPACLDGYEHEAVQRVAAEGLTYVANDEAVDYPVGFEEYVKLLNIDVKKRSDFID